MRASDVMLGPDGIVACAFAALLATIERSPKTKECLSMEMKTSTNNDVSGRLQVNRKFALARKRRPL